MISEAFLLKPFKHYQIPPFPCPSCGASLVMRDKGFECDQSGHSRAEYEEASCIEMVYGIFNLRLVCSQVSCKETVSCIGKYWQERDENQDGQPFTVRVLTPVFFYPTIHIFTLPENFPPQVQKPLLESFSLFWSNPSASGNMLRIALENLMDNQRVRKSGRDEKGKRFLLSLHARTIEFAKNNREIGDKVTALKWLGNWGSHSKGLKPEHLITAFKLMQYIIEELFEKRSRNLTVAAKKINQRKGPISKVQSMAARPALA